MKKASVGVGLIGLGVIGGEVARVLIERAELLAEHAGCPVVLKKVKALQVDMARPIAHTLTALNPHLITTDEDEFFNEPGLDIIIEAIGGEHPAYEYLSRTLSMGKYAVTPNKEVIAKHGAELLLLAQKNGVGLRFGGSVGGGIPLIAPVQHELIVNKISCIYAIINGTTNYILTRMAKEGIDFTSALKKAQELGYAEPNPSNDIEGIDAAYKIAILASLAFRSQVKPEDVFREGISHLSSRDFQYAKELGYVIKLLAIAKQNEKDMEARVHPVLISQDSQLAQVGGVYNAIQIEGDLVGTVLFYGQGAGAKPTSSTVLADVISSAKDITQGNGSRVKWQLKPDKPVKPMAEVETKSYLRLNVVDQPGVLAQIATILGENSISISQVIQKFTDPVAQTAEIVIMTHPARESALQHALAEIQKLPIVKEIGSFIRVEA